MDHLLRSALIVSNQVELAVTAITVATAATSTADGAGNTLAAADGRLAETGRLSFGEPCTFLVKSLDKGDYPLVN